MTQTPDQATFERLVAPGVAIPVVRDLPMSGVDPLEAFAELAAGQTHAALLETSEPGCGDADMSIVAPFARAVLSGPDVLDQVRAACADEVADTGVELPRCVGGAIGMLGHEHVRTIEPRVPAAAGPHPSGAPDTAFLIVDTLLVFEHRVPRLRAIHTVVVPSDLEHFDAASAYHEAVAQLNMMETRLAGLPSHEGRRAAAAPEGAEDPFAAVTSNLAPGEYGALVEAAQHEVLNGQCVQIVVSQRFDRSFGADPVAAYRALRSVSPAPYHVLLRLAGARGPVHIVGASPEQLVGVLDGRVVTHPIAGTRPRGGDEAQDLEHERDLLADPKERCEHMMLVDLGRNDVGRVAVPGTVEVGQLCEIERFSHVMHLVSRVEADLRPDLHPVDALRSAFPAGTLTGAPKVRAMELIAGFERDQRGPYGGAVGYVGHGRMLDMAITIRSAVLANGMAYVQAGAGVVAASDPVAEEAETRAKARSVLQALAQAEAQTMQSEAVAVAGGAA